MKVLGIAGWSGSGKTTLVTQLILELVARGISVSTIKHAHHAFDIDQPGKDSYKHRDAGAREVMVGSRTRWVLTHELRTCPELTLNELLQNMAPVDIVLVEGFKFGDHDKIEVYRDGYSDTPLYPDDPNVIAIVSDTPLTDMDRPIFNSHDIMGIGEFVIAHCDLATSKNDSA